MANRRSKNQHVIPRDGVWIVKGAGNDRPTSIHQSQAEAIEAAREIAKTQRSEVVIHRYDGRIRDRERYGPDPLPPKSPRKILFPTTPSTTSKERIKKAIREVVRDSGQRAAQSAPKG